MGNYRITGFYTTMRNPGRRRRDKISCPNTTFPPAPCRAAELAGEDSLKPRAGDARHLAIAECLSAQGILCLDDAMIASAKSLWMKVVVV
ncbi:MAG: hypothetical protein HY848_10390 [Betaproteobacteria bacterium]|nr:hypothetical protein [Betaproteobacteria bacterium]